MATSGSSDDEIYDRYLRKAIREINELNNEISRAAGDRTPVVGSGHPLGDMLMVKWSPQRSETQEGVAFFGRAGQAILKSLQRLRVDPLAVYGTNCVKFEGADADETAQAWFSQELHIVQPKLLIVMGERALAFVNALGFPLSRPLEDRPGEIQQFTATVQALATPDVDESLDEAPAKTAFWNAFRALGPWWAALPPY
ncbi:MAG: uracil-DNA glycosylase family protein [Gaiellaceae bacterium]